MRVSPEFNGDWIEAEDARRGAEGRDEGGAGHFVDEGDGAVEVIGDVRGIPEFIGGVGHGFSLILRAS
ncbi:MAG: hypothetical protein ABII68_03615, partial [Pseudomonadota bacterium]